MFLRGRLFLLIVLRALLEGLMTLILQNETVVNLHISIFIRTFAHLKFCTSKKLMGLFDFFKKKESTQEEQEALDTGFRKNQG